MTLSSQSAILFRKSTRFITSVILIIAAALSCAHAGETVTYFHNDVAGSPTLSTDVNGIQVWKETYRPYGDRLHQASASATNNLWFTGKPNDASTGLSYMGARYYDPTLGRFLGVDPEPLNLANLHSLNRYAYANNNPHRYVDPTGEIPVDTLWDAANVVYDVGKITVGWSIGNQALVVEGSKDLIADGIALAVPYMPAGSTKIARASIETAAKSIDRISDTGQAAKSAFEIAKAGGKHAGFLKNYVGRTPAEIQKGIASIEKQIAEHRSWISNPQSKIPNFGSLDPRQQAALINSKWPSDIARQQEQLDVLRGLLGGN